MPGVGALGGDNEVSPHEAVASRRRYRDIAGGVKEALDKRVHGLRGKVAERAMDVDVMCLLDERDQPGEYGRMLRVVAALGGERLDGAGEASDDQGGLSGFTEEGLAVER